MNLILALISLVRWLCTTVAIKWGQAAVGALVESYVEGRFFQFPQWSFWTCAMVMVKASLAYVAWSGVIMPVAIRLWTYFRSPLDYDGAGNLFKSRLQGFFTRRRQGSIRRQFRNILQMPAEEPEGAETDGKKDGKKGIHSHPKAGKARDNADNILCNAARAMGFEPYQVSMSKRNNGQDGTHMNYMARDHLVDTKSDWLTSKHIVILNDVDYYIDPTHWARNNAVFMSTFAPNKVGGKVIDGCYSIANNTVDYRVRGGTKYTHRLWDYNTDFVVRYGWWKTTVMSVERVDLGDQRQLVALVPEADIYGPMGWMVDGYELKRRVISRDGFNRIDYLDEEGDMVSSLGFEGRTSHVELQTNLLDMLQIRHNTSKNPTIATVETVLRSADQSGQTEKHSPLVFKIIEANGGGKLAKSVDFMSGAGKPNTGTSFQNLQSSALHTALVYDDGKRIGRETTSPLVSHPDIMPRSSYNNDVVSIDGRVESVRNFKTPPFFIGAFLAEFLKLLIPIPGLGTPESMDYVYEQQTRPAQKIRAAGTFSWFCDVIPRVSAFMKQEAVKAGNFPRNISQTPTNMMLNASRFTFGFKRDVLKKMSWYLPGLTPLQIATRLFHILRSFGESVIATDYTKFDGTISAWLRVYVERAAYLRWVALPYHDEMNKILFEDATCSGKTSNGLRYNPGAGRLSGSAFTTDGNTIINAFVAFVGLRFDGYTPEQCWTRMMGYAGDDGITVGSASKAMQAAEIMGLLLKVDTILPGNPVPLLGRWFGNPWASINSMQDVARTLRKIHITCCDVGIPIKHAAVNKARGYLVNDSGTPGISHWCRWVVRAWGDEVDDQVLSEHQRDTLNADRTYWTRESEGECWPNVHCESFAAMAAKDLGVTASEFLDFCDKIEATPEGTPFPVLEIAAPQSKFKAEIDGVSCTTPETTLKGVAYPPGKVKKDYKQLVRTCENRTAKADGKDKPVLTSKAKQATATTDPGKPSEGLEKQARPHYRTVPKSRRR